MIGFTRALLNLQPLYDHFDHVSFSDRTLIRSESNFSGGTMLSVCPSTNFRFRRSWHADGSVYLGSKMAAKEPTSGRKNNLDLLLKAGK